MNKVIKVISGIGKGLLILLSVLAVFLIVMTVINRIMLKKEAAVFDKPIGQMVEVDDHNMCVYTEGEGDHTIVFLSGSSIPSPILDYKPLYSRLTDDYRIVVIEKFGYGYSDVVDSERSFETMLRQDREALASLGIEGPFILCPHSMSGLEALMWAQDYPEEVEAIVGLDMTVPETYDDFAERLEDMKSTKWIYDFLRTTGLLRLLPDSVFSIPGTLSEEEIQTYRQILYVKLLNETVYNEAFYVEEARDRIRSSPKPLVPMILFVSDGTGTGRDEETWHGYTEDYARGMDNISVICLSCGHDLHHVEYEAIEENMRDFIENSLDK